MKAVLLVVILMLLSGAVQAQEVTPEPTPEVTSVPTANYYIDLTTPGGEPARVERTVTAGELAIFGGVMFLALSLWGMYLSDRVGGGKRR